MRRHRNRRSESRARQLLNQTVNRWMEPLDSRVLMTGTVFATSIHDLNSNGVKDPEEPALQGWTVFVDYNRNGALNAGEPSGTTDIDGEVFITDVPSGTWDIVQVLEPGWGSAPGTDNVLREQVRDNEETEVLYLNVPAANGSIQGTVWNDINGDGVRQPTDPGLSGWTVFLDDNNDGDPNPGEVTALTNASGFYSMPDLPTGNYRVREVLPGDWDVTIGYDNGVQVNVNPGAPTTVDFGNFNTGTLGGITGTVWNDINADGIRSAADNGLADWTVFIDSNANSVLDIGEQSAVTDPLGGFSFPSIIAGTYRVMEVLQAGWNTSPGYPAVRNVTVVGDNTSNVQFAVFTPTLGSVSGAVWNDSDGNGIRNGEPGIPGWTVYIDSDSDGALDAGENSAVTDASGNYTLANVGIGGNLVREIPAIGWNPTAPATAQQLVNVPNGTNVAGINFGNQQRTNGAISGVAYADRDEDHIRDTGENGLAGITVYIDANNNNSLDAGEQSAVTSADLFYTPAVDEAGTYSFTHLAAGDYVVREILPPVLSATLETDRRKLITLVPGEDRTGVDFANRYREIELHGVKYDDTNGNHQRDPGEPGIPGVTIYLDIDRDNILDATEPRTVTAADGSYGFTNNLVPASYIVREIVPWGWTQQYPQTTGGILWPTGTSNAPIGNVSPTLIQQSLTQGQTFTQTVSLTLPTTGAITNKADVFLLFDDTGSFTGNSPIVRAAFPQIISALQAALPGIDLGFGVGRLEEYANFAAENATGRPFILNQPIVSQSTPGFSTAIQAALNRTAPGYGGDLPETVWEALYQTVTGKGFDGNNNGTYTDSGAAGQTTTQLTPGASGDVPSFASFNPGAGVLAPDGSIGGVGFRPGALPIILTATDTGFAFQPRGETSITGIDGLTLPLSAFTQTSRGTTPFNSGAGIQETITGLNALGALVIGLGTNPGAMIDPRLGLESIARMTGSINRSLTTIANGTLDPIAPGDPLYFQISSGFGSSVANGVISAIQNAVTNTAVNIALKSSDPRVHITSNPGVINGVGSGETATFDVTFTGDGRPHRFDLQFVREGTDVVLGSIPIVLGTPISGHGWHYDDLEEGEIDDTVDFGNQRDPLTPPNVAPSFTAGSNVTVAEDSGLQLLNNWATNILTGPPSEVTQVLDFIVTSDNAALFSVQPAISVDGTLAFQSAPNANGSATVTVRLHDNGGTFTGGSDISDPITFTINITPEAALSIGSNFEFETRQALTVDFNQDVSTSLTMADLVVTDLATSAPITLQSFEYDSVNHRATVRFDPLVLADGNYRLSIAADALPGMSGAYSADFYAFAGDANRDRAVNISDFSVLASRFNQPGTFSQGDFNYDGQTNIGDFAMLAAKFNTTLPAFGGRGLSAAPPRPGASLFSNSTIRQDVLEEPI